MDWLALTGAGWRGGGWWLGVRASDSGMTYIGPGFVDYHSHLLRTSSGTAPPWGVPAGVRSYHEHCAAMGMTPVDALEEPEVDGLPGRLFAGLRQAAGYGLVEVWEAGVRHWAFLDALAGLREKGPLPV